MNKFLIIGLGVFGKTLALKLMQKGVEVVAVDKKMENIDEIQNDVTYAISLDSTDEKALNSLGLKDFDVGIVCFGEDFEAILLTSVLLKNSGINKVITRASNPVHIKILKAVGIDQIITPEIEIAEKLASSLFNDNLMNIIHIDEKTAVARIKTPESFINKSIGQLNLRAKYGINVVALEHSNIVKEGNKEKEEKTVNNNPSAETIINKNDILLVIGEQKSLQKISKV